MTESRKENTNGMLLLVRMHPLYLLLTGRWQGSLCNRHGNATNKKPIYYRVATKTNTHQAAVIFFSSSDCHVLWVLEKLRHLRPNLSEHGKSTQTEMIFVC